MIERATAHELIDRWIDAWNRHDLDAIMDMCDDDIEFVSPFLVSMYDTPSGALHGKDALRGWFAQSATNPSFHIEPPIHVLTGVDTIVLVESITERRAADGSAVGTSQASERDHGNGVVAANVFTVGADGRFTRSVVHG